MRACSPLVRLVLEELTSVLSPEVAEQVLELVLAGTGSLDTGDAESLLAMADHALRDELRARLRRPHADALVDQIQLVLVHHVSSAEPARPRTGRATPRPPESERSPSVGVVLGTDRTLQLTLVAGLRSLGIVALPLGSADALGSSPAAAWVEAFVVTSDLPVSQVRELAWWVVAERDEPVPVVVWPTGTAETDFARAIPDAISLHAPDLVELAAALRYSAARAAERTAADRTRPLKASG